jgi:hypothetical protein
MTLEEPRPSVWRSVQLPGIAVEGWTVEEGGERMAAAFLATWQLDGRLPKGNIELFEVKTTPAYGPAPRYATVSVIWRITGCPRCGRFLTIERQQGGLL